NLNRAKTPRLKDRSCGSAGRGPAENRNVRGAMGCPPHARAAYESIANAPTAPRNISPPWAGARAEMSPYPLSGALPSLKIAQDLAKADGWVRPECFLHVPPLFNHLVGEVSSIERPRGLPVSAAVVRQGSRRATPWRRRSCTGCWS